MSTANTTLVITIGWDSANTIPTASPSPAYADTSARGTGKPVIWKPAANVTIHGVTVNGASSQPTAAGPNFVWTDPETTVPYTYEYVVSAAYGSGPVTTLDPQIINKID